MSMRSASPSAARASDGLMETGFQCAGCGEWNATVVDEGGGAWQQYVEDCQVCCQPNVLTIEFDSEAQAFAIAAELEG